MPDAPEPAATIAEILAALNALSLSEVSRVGSEITRVQAALASLGQAELASRVGEARAALLSGNVKEFRRAVSNVTARLGHVK